MGCDACNNESKWSQIMEGWGNFIFKNKAAEDLAKYRSLRCATCSKNVLGICIECSCPIIAKTRSPNSSCRKW